MIWCRVRNCNQTSRILLYTASQ